MNILLRIGAAALAIIAAVVIVELYFYIDRKRNIATMRRIEDQRNFIRGIERLEKSQSANYAQDSQGE